MNKLWDDIFHQHSQSILSGELVYHQIFHRARTDAVRFLNPHQVSWRNLRIVVHIQISLETGKMAHGKVKSSYFNSNPVNDTTTKKQNMRSKKATFPVFWITGAALIGNHGCHKLKPPLALQSFTAASQNIKCQYSSGEIYWYSSEIHCIVLHRLNPHTESSCVTEGCFPTFAAPTGNRWQANWSGHTKMGRFWGEASFPVS